MKWGDFWRQFRKDSAALFGLLVLLILLFTAVVGPSLVRADPAQQNLQLRRAPVSAMDPFGRDQFGRDMLSRIVHGARVTMLSGVVATAIGSVFGFLAGLISGYLRGWVDEVFMRAVDLMLAFPFFLVAILIVGILGPELRNAILAVGIAKIPIFARYVRGVTLKLAQEGFIEAAQAVGANKLRIMLVHIVPNVTIPAIVLATVELASTILSVSGLSFLGLGAQPPTPEWGLMLSESRSYFQQAPHIMIFPGVFLSLLVLSINLVGDGLQLATDPRRRGS